MPDPKENPQATPTDPRILRERAIIEARQEREGLARIGDEARRTGTAIRELLERQRRPSPIGYRFFYLGDTRGQPVIQGVERVDGQAGDVMAITYDGDTAGVRDNLQRHCYPSADYEISERDGVLSVRRKGGDIVARLRKSDTPRFMRAIIAYNKAVDGETLRGANLEEAGMTTILCANPDHIIATAGGTPFTLREYLEHVHGCRTRSNTSWNGVFYVNGPRGQTADVITDGRSITVLRALCPLAERASTDASARRELREHLQRIDLPRPAYTVLIKHILKPAELSEQVINSLADCTPSRCPSYEEQRVIIANTRRLVTPQQWQLLEEAGMTYVIPEDGVRRGGTLRAEQVNNDADNVQMVVSGDQGSIDLTAEWLRPGGWSIVARSGYHYIPIRPYRVTVDFNHIHEPYGVISTYHEIGHANDPNIIPLSIEEGQVEHAIGTAVVNSHNASIQSAQHELVRRFMLLRRCRAVLYRGRESFAWMRSFDYTRETHRRTGYHVVRDRFQTFAQFYRHVTERGYHTYLNGDLEIKDFPQTQEHFPGHRQFVDRLYDLGGFEEECRLVWAGGDIADIMKLSGDARVKAIDTFNFRYGLFPSKKFHPFAAAGDGQFFALNGRGELQTFENEQAYRTARAAAPMEIAPITTRWWEGYSSAARIARQLEHCHRFRNSPGMFNLTFEQLKFLEKLQTAKRPAGTPAERLERLSSQLRGHSFGEEQINFLTYGGFFDEEVAKFLRERGSPSSPEHLVRATAAASAFDDYAMNAQRLMNPGGEPAFVALRPAQQKAILDAVAVGANTSLSVEKRLIDIQIILSPHFTAAQREFMLWEGHFDRPDETIIAARARIFTNLNLASVPLYERIWHRGGLDAGVTRAEMIDIALKLNINLTNVGTMSDGQVKARVEQRVNALTGRKG